MNKNDLVIIRECLMFKKLFLQKQIDSNNYHAYFIIQFEEEITKINSVLKNMDKDEIVEAYL